MPNRNPQPLGRKGSLKWIQVMVNDHPHLLSEAVGVATGISPDKIEWVSPLAADSYAEYRDYGFLDRLGIALADYSLSMFWPARGPQWDALGRAQGQVILIEAKAYLKELITDPCQATPASLARIKASLGLVKQSLGVPSEIDWTGRYYQYANRLAHLYLLRHLNQIPAELVHVCFLNDHERQGPTTAAEWQIALQQVHYALGITDNPLLQHMHHVFLDVGSIAKAGPTPEPISTGVTI
jgi:hypothetical protein